MRSVLTASLTTNIVLLACLILFHNEHLKDSEFINTLSGQVQTWRTNAYTALDLAQRCAEGTVPDSKKDRK